MLKFRQQKGHSFDFRISFGENKPTSATCLMNFIMYPPKLDKNIAISKEIKSSSSENVYGSSLITKPKVQPTKIPISCVASVRQ